MDFKKCDNVTKKVRGFDHYLRFCRRCSEVFKTETKHGRICEKCKLQRMAGIDYID